MRILHVYKDYYPILGGIENHMRLLAEHQAAAGHQVSVLVTDPGRRSRIQVMNGVRVISTGRLATIASTPLSLSLPMHLARQRPDITHLHYPYPVGEVAQYLLGHGRRTVLTYHSDVVRQQSILRLYRPLMERVLRRMDRILVTTPNYLASSATLQYFRDRCQIVPFGIDQEPFRSAPPDAGAALRRSLGDGPIILFVGVLRYYKGLQYLLDAMPHVPARLLIVGEGPMGESLRAQARDLQLADRVTFLGRVEDEDLPACYRAADIFVLPASERSEAFGLVQVEAMAAGLPVVSTELGTGTSYVNKDGESGLVVAPRDPAALAGAINNLLKDEPLRLRLARGALQRADLFTAERMVADIQRIYDEVAG
jgi:rhamnosyl/mannosyltransferase